MGKPFFPRDPFSKSVLNCFPSGDYYLRTGGEIKTCQDDLSKSLQKKNSTIENVGKRFQEINLCFSMCDTEFFFKCETGIRSLGKRIFCLFFL